MTKEPTIMVKLWHPCREIDVWYTESNDDRKIAISQGYITLSGLRRREKIFRALYKRCDDQIVYIKQLERLLKEND